MKILVVEDDRKLARFLIRVLTEEGYTADACASGVDAIEQAASGVYGLVILDWMLPDVDGLETCRRLRRAGLTLPVMMLTARGEVQERVLGLKAGADDYLVKPFEVDELVARVNALVRRAQGQHQLDLGPLHIDRTRRLVLVAGREVELTARELSLLLNLALRCGQIVTRGDLLSQVWSVHFDPESNVIEAHMSRLRDKLGDHQWMIETVRGRGYRLRTQRPER
jgi:DNA-binding response OmpR family regulator